MSVNHDLERTEITPRTSLIIFLKNSSYQYKLRRYGDIVYFSKKMGYCVLYVDSTEVNDELEEISQLDFVKHVERSNEENIDLSSSHIEGQISEMAKEADNKLLNMAKERGDVE